MIILNLKNILDMISDEANQNCTNKGFESQFPNFDIRQVKSLEYGINAFRTSTSIAFKRVNNNGQAEFEITNNNSSESHIIFIPYINGIEKLNGCNNINFSLAELLMQVYDIDQLNELHNKIPKNTDKEIREFIEFQSHIDLFGLPDEIRRELGFGDTDVIEIDHLPDEVRQQLDFEYNCDMNQIQIN